VAAAPDAVWRVVGDPNHLARWWPKVQRVERVESGGFTKVFVTKNGRPVRADFTVAHDDAPRARRWAQVVDDTPFERILVSSEEAAIVEPAEAGATVTLEVRQKLRGIGKLGGFLVRRATRRQLDEALDGLERIV
jgi:carbon monoxide dehydrogenase subunit G